LSIHLPNRLIYSLPFPCYDLDQSQDLLHIEFGYLLDGGGLADIEFHLQALVVWNKQGEVPVANIYPVRSVRAVVFCAGIAVGRNVNPIQDEMFARVEGSARELSLVHVEKGHDGVPYSVGDVVVFSQKYHSGVPCLSAFRFPTP
jgi:hypothetical protein